MSDDQNKWTVYARSAYLKIQHLQDNVVYPLANSWKVNYSSLYEANDARVYWFIGLARLLNNFKLAYIAIYQMGDTRWWQAVSKESNETNIKDWIREFEVYVTWAYVHALCTITEETFRRLSVARGDIETGSLKSKYDKLLKDTNLLQYLPLFDLFRLIRNTAHNNGIYLPETQKDEIVLWNGKSYSFKVGYGLDFVNSEFIINVLTKDLAKAMNELMTHSKIITLPAVSRRVKVTP